MIARNGTNFLFSKYTIGSSNELPLTEIFCSAWEELTDKRISWINQHDGGPHEANFLKLDCSRIKSVLQWKPVWDIKEAIVKTIELYITCSNSIKLKECIHRQISEYLEKI